MSTFEIVSYNKQNMCHRVKYADGTTGLVDVMVSGNLTEETPESLIGRRVECEYTYPFISIAWQPKLLPKETQPNS